MKHELWLVVEEAFSMAIQLPPPERTGFSNAAYADQPDVRFEVESLLKHREAAEQLSPMSVLAAVAEMLTNGDDDTQPIGNPIAGKYLIRERLGAGGIAEVYLADHLSLNVPVDLKLAKPSYRTDPGFRKTFLEEAQRAVILDHDIRWRWHQVRRGWRRFTRQEDA
jgi:serine/threonine protein kinase